MLKIFDTSRIFDLGSTGGTSPELGGGVQCTPCPHSSDATGEDSDVVGVREECGDRVDGLLALRAEHGVVVAEEVDVQRNVEDQERTADHHQRQRRRTNLDITRRQRSRRQQTSPAVLPTSVPV